MQLRELVNPIPSGPEKSKGFIARKKQRGMRARRQIATGAAVRKTYFVP
jgi:hypothetical protein